MIDLFRTWDALVKSARARGTVIWWFRTGTWWNLNTGEEYDNTTGPR